MGGPEMAPHTPRRSSRPGKAVARLDNPIGAVRAAGAATAMNAFSIPRLLETSSLRLLEAWYIASSLPCGALLS